MRNPDHQLRCMRGFSLLEGLIAMLVFSLGAIGMIEMQARAVQLSTEAQDRANASFLINRLISEVALQDSTTGNPDPSAPYLLSRTACSDGIPGTHPAAAWANEVCASFDEARVTLARPSGVTAGFLSITIEWRGRYKITDAIGVLRDAHRMEVTNRFQWQ